MKKNPRDRLSRVGKEHVCPAAAGQDRAAALSSRSSLAQSEAEFDAALAVFHSRAECEAYEIPAAEA